MSRCNDGSKDLELANIVSEQKFAYEFVKRLVHAWDPDYTKLTPNEELSLKEAEEEYKNGEYVEYKF